MKVLVLGGSGFIGRHLVRRLLSEGHQVRVFDRHADQVGMPDVESVVADFADHMSLSEALTGIDKVIHLVSTSVPSTSNKDPISDVSSNLINTLNLLKLMRESNIDDIIYFSSGGTVYGHPRTLPIPETHSTNPICSYGIVKLAIEKYLFMYSELYDFNVVILRPSNPYGPGQRHMGVQGFIGTCISAAIKNKLLTIWGDGEVKRDYLYVTDVVNATLLALKHDKSDIFNISIGVGYSLNQIIEYVNLAAKHPVKVEYQLKRDFDIPEITLDNSKAERLLKWTPNVSLESGLTMTIKSLIDYEISR